MKTSHTSTGIITELSPALGYANAFYVSNYEGGQGVTLADRDSIPNVNIKRAPFSSADNTWKHIVIVIDTNLDANNSTKIFVNKIQITLETLYGLNQNTINNFGSYPLFIGQRGGSSLGFNGQIKFLKVFNYPLSTTEITNLYNKTM